MSACVGAGGLPQQTSNLPSQPSGGWVAPPGEVACDSKSDSSAGGSRLSSASSNSRRRKKNKKKEKIPPAAPNTYSECPCVHNNWDNVRVKKGQITLRCRECQEQWKTETEKVRKCQNFFNTGTCANGTGCPNPHIHRYKQSLAKRKSIFGDGLLTPKQVEGEEEEEHEHEHEQQPLPPASTASLRPGELEKLQEQITMQDHLQNRHPYQQQQQQPLYPYVDGPPPVPMPSYDRRASSGSSAGPPALENHGALSFSTSPGDGSLIPGAGGNALLIGNRSTFGAGPSGMGNSRPGFGQVPEGMIGDSDSETGTPTAPRRKKKPGSVGSADSNCSPIMTDDVGQCEIDSPDSLGGGEMTDQDIDDMLERQSNGGDPVQKYEPTLRKEAAQRKAHSRTSSADLDGMSDHGGATSSYVAPIPMGTQSGFSNVFTAPAPVPAPVPVEFPGNVVFNDASQSSFGIGNPAPPSNQGGGSSGYNTPTSAPGTPNKGQFYVPQNPPLPHMSLQPEPYANQVC